MGKESFLFNDQQFCLGSWSTVLIVTITPGERHASLQRTNRSVIACQSVHSLQCLSSILSMRGEVCLQCPLPRGRITATRKKETVELALTITATRCRRCHFAEWLLLNTNCWLTLPVLQWVVAKLSHLLLCSTGTCLSALLFLGFYLICFTVKLSFSWRVFIVYCLSPNRSQCTYCI